MNLSPFPHSLSISSSFSHSLSISSSFPHSLSISSQPGSKAPAGCDTLKQPIAFFALIQFWSTNRNLFSPTNDRENSFSMYGQTKRGQLYIGHLLNTYQPQSRATLTDCQRHEDRSEAAHLNGKTYFKQFLYFIWKFVLVSRVKNIHKIAVHFALV